MEKKYHTLYQIVNKINGMIYIGIHSTNNLFDSYMGSGKNIKSAINEFGRENFIKYIIGLYDSRYEMIQAEILIVNKNFVLREDTYNLTTGGGVSPFTIPMLEETKSKISIALNGHIVSEETKQRISESNTGKILTEEVKQKISKANKGRIFSEEWKDNISNSKKGQKPSNEAIQRAIEVNRGRKHTEETKRKISEASKNISEETRQKISKANKNRKHTEEAKRNMRDGCKIEFINK